MERELEVQLLSAGEVFTTLHVLAFREHQTLSRPAYFEVRALLEEQVPLHQLLGTDVQLVFGFPEAPSNERAVRGTIESAELEASPTGHAFAPTYVFRVVTPVALLERSVDCQIFQGQTVQQIVTQVLDAHGVPSDQLDWELKEQLPTREYCVQYRESALNFVSRLLECEGIYYFTELEQGRELPVLRFRDTSQLAPRCIDDPLRILHGGHLQGEIAGHRLDTIELARSGKVTLRAQNWLHPADDLTQSVSAGAFSDLELYEFTADYDDTQRGRLLAQRRLEEEQTPRSTLHLTSDCPALSAGCSVGVQTAAADFELFLTSVTHTYSNDRLLRPDAVVANTYLVEAEGIPHEVPFRPARDHQAPLIVGPQTATVVATEDAEAESIHTEEFGRCKVRFHWDRSGKMYDDASCWMRVSQLQTSGSMVLPRVGWEVIVEFLRGNPDHPLVTGRLYNGTFMPPYALPEGRTRTALRTASTPGGSGANELRFEDKAGSEEVAISSQYNTLMKVANTRRSTIGKDQTINVTNNASLEVGADQTVQITNGQKNTVTADQSLSVGANRTVSVNAVYGLTVAADASTTVSGNHMEMDGNPLEAILSLAMSRAAEVVSAEATKVIDQVEAAVQGAVGQVLAPIQAVEQQVAALDSRMRSVTDGNLAAAVGVTAGASALPSLSALGRVAASPPAATSAGPENSVSSAGITAAAAINAATTGALRAAVQKTKGAIGNASGHAGDAGGGASMANVGGPAGDLSGFSESDLSQGPGYSDYTVTGTHKETISALRVTLAANNIMRNSKSTTETVGAAHVELIKGAREESVEGASQEKSPAMVVVSKADYNVSVEGDLKDSVAGALVQDIKGNRALTAAGDVLVSAPLHQIKAKTKITLTCGASSLVIDGSGVTVTAPVVEFKSSAIKLKKNVNDG